MGKRARTRAAPAVVVGRRPALEAIRSGSAKELLMARGTRPSPGLRELEAEAARSGTPVRRVPVEQVEDLAGGVRHQGVAARISLPAPLGEQGLAGRAWGPEDVVLVLDGVTDPQNLGAVARTAEAAGTAAIVVRRHRGSALGAAAVKASAGALLHLTVAEVPNITRALERLKEGGFWVVGLDQDAPNNVGEARPPPGRLALVMGGEAEGLSRLVRRTCDELLSIPMRGRVSSLNVSVAAGVALFAYAGLPPGAGRA